MVIDEMRETDRMAESKDDERSFQCLRFSLKPKRRTFVRSVIVVLMLSLLLLLFLPACHLRAL